MPVSHKSKKQKAMKKSHVFKKKIKKTQKHMRKMKGGKKTNVIEKPSVIKNYFTTNFDNIYKNIDNNYKEQKLNEIVDAFNLFSKTQTINDEDDIKNYMFRMINYGDDYDNAIEILIEIFDKDFVTYFVNLQEMNATQI